MRIVTGAERATRPAYEMRGRQQLELRIENEAVAGFLDGQAYTDAYIKGTGESYVLPYSAAKPYDQSYTERWTAIPRPLIIAGRGSTLELTVDGVTTTMSHDGLTKVWNCIPGKTYSWRLKDGATVHSTGSATVTGLKRMIYNGGIPNVRDIGGWPCTGGRVKYGRIIRGFGMTYVDGHLTAFDDETVTSANPGIATLLDLGVAHEIDLRSPGTGSNSQHDTTAKGWWDWFGCPLAGYNNFFTNATGKASIVSGITKLVEWLEADDGNIYMHCYAGQDRTGMMVACIMALVGCSLDSIVKEWELTNLQIDTGIYISNGSENLRTALQTLTSASSPDYVAAMVSKLRSIGITTALQARLAACLVESD